MKIFMLIIFIGLLFLSISTGILAQTNCTICLDDDSNEPELLLTTVSDSSFITYLDDDANEPNEPNEPE